MRKNLKKNRSDQKIDIRDLVKSANKLPVFSESIPNVRNECRKPNSPKEIFLQLWRDNRGGISKRAVFFSLFGIIAVIYIILCIAGIVKFDREIAAYIIAGNIAFGFAYHEKNKTGQ